MHCNRGKLIEVIHKSTVLDRTVSMPLMSFPVTSFNKGCVDIPIYTGFCSTKRFGYRSRGVSIQREATQT